MYRYMTYRLCNPRIGAWESIYLRVKNASPMELASFSSLSKPFLDKQLTWFIQTASRLADLSVNRILHLSFINARPGNGGILRNTRDIQTAATQTLVYTYIILSLCYIAIALHRFCLVLVRSLTFSESLSRSLSPATTATRMKSLALLFRCWPYTSTRICTFASLWLIAWRSSQFC